MAYKKQNFKNGEILTAEDLNAMDEQLYNLLKNFSELNTASNFKFTEVTTAGTDLNNYIVPGVYYFTSNLGTKNIPSGTNGWLVVLKVPTIGNVKQIWLRSGSEATHHFIFLRTRIEGEWENWVNINSPTHYNNPRYVYVDSQSGNDSNSGTASEPFKTLNRAFNLYNEGYIDLRIKIVKDGTYTFDKCVFNSITLHIENTTKSPVTIKCSENRYNVSFYGSHINSQGINWSAADGRLIYFEGCTAVFSALVDSDGTEKPISILPTVKTFGGFISIPQLKTGGLDLEYCTARLPEVTIEVTNNSYNLLHKATYRDIIFSLTCNVFFRNLQIILKNSNSSGDFRYYNISGSEIEKDTDSDFPDPNNGPINSFIKRNTIYCTNKQKNTLESKTDKIRNQWITD